MYKISDLIMKSLPKNDLSHWVGRLAHQQLPGPLGTWTVSAFAKAYNINLDEAEFEIEKYRSVGELFTRRLKPGARPIEDGIVHPCDARVTEAGVIGGEQILQAKGMHYTLTEFLRSPHWAETFCDGHFVTYYLCPTDYHRVHYPVSGDLIWSSHVPGDLWPVHDHAVRTIPHLFVSNERISAVIETARGRVAVVMVAATNVGNMQVFYDENISTNSRDAQRHAREKSYQPAVSVKKGDELGVFKMGSTVIVIFEKSFKAQVSEMRGRNVKMGQTLFV